LNFRLGLGDPDLTGCEVQPAVAAPVRGDRLVHGDSSKPVLGIPGRITHSLCTLQLCIHYCLGAHLAGIELAEALTTMARQMPNIRRAGPAPWKSITGITGPASLPVEFTVCP
jgi:hypothetical protein